MLRLFALSMGILLALLHTGCGCERQLVDALDTIIEGGDGGGSGGGGSTNGSTGSAPTDAERYAADAVRRVFTRVEDSGGTPYAELGARSSHGWLLTRGLGLRRCPVLVLNLVVPGLDPHGPPDGTPLIRDSGTIAPAIAA